MAISWIAENMAVQRLRDLESGKADDTDKGRCIEIPSEIGRTRYDSAAHGPWNCWSVAFNIII